MRALFERSAETNLIAGYLRQKKVGEVVTYDMLTQHVGKTSIDKIRSAIRSAMRILEAEGMVWETVRKVGIVLLDDNQAVESSAKFIGRAHSASIRGLKRLKAVELDKLSSESRGRHIARWSHLNMIRVSTSTENQQKITAAANAHGKALPFAQSLRAIS